jgi:hypothetical protein
VGHGVINCFSIYGGPDLDFRKALGIPPGVVAGATLSHEGSASDAELVGGTADPGPTSGAASQAEDRPKPPRMDRIWVDIWEEIEKDAEGNPMWENGKVYSLKSYLIKLRRW